MSRLCTKNNKRYGTINYFDQNYCYNISQILQKTVRSHLTDFVKLIFWINCRIIHCPSKSGKIDYPCSIILHNDNTYQLSSCCFSGDTIFQNSVIVFKVEIGTNHTIPHVFMKCNKRNEFNNPTLLWTVSLLCWW